MAARLKVFVTSDGLTDYVVAARDRLAAQSLETLLQGEAQWPKA